MIVQLFNHPFQKIQKQLPKLQRLGFSHILVSPPQKSHASDRWWGRYQPVDFTRIEGPLGNAADLHNLCVAAGRRNLKIVVDAVLHHLSNEPRYVRIRGHRILSAQYPHFSSNDLRGVHRLGRGRGLPVLDTRSPWVRQQLRNYLRMLYDLGVRGFRFDSAKHLDPQLFPYLLAGLPPLLCFGELVYSAPQDFPPAYWQSMKAYDFPLAHSLKRSFAMGGDLGALLLPQALWGPLSIGFVNHHDLVKNRKGFEAFRIADLRDRQLAYAYLLARPHGTPLIYGADLGCAEVKAGLQLRQITQSQEMIPLAASSLHVAFAAGNGALLINKGGHGWKSTVKVAPGLYRDLIQGQLRSTSQGTLHWELPPRSALLLERVTP